MYSQPLVREFLASQFGAGAPVSVHQEAKVVPGSYTRWKGSGPVAAGDALEGADEEGDAAVCTAGFGSRAQVDEEHGEPVYFYFALTAGHCYPKGNAVYRSTEPWRLGYHKVGSVTRRQYGVPGQSAPVTDAEAVNVPEKFRSRGIFYGYPKALLPVQGVERPRVGMHVCWSGVSSKVDCARIVGRRRGEVDGREFYGAVVSGPIAEGDSGGPVWNRDTVKAVGMMSDLITGPKCSYLPNEPLRLECPRFIMTPLLPFKGRANPVGILATLGVEVLKE